MMPLKWECRGVRGEWGVFGSLVSVVGEGKAPNMGPYLPIKIAHAPSMLYGIVCPFV